MPLAILALALFLIFYLVKTITNAELAGVVLAVLSVLITLTYQECRYILGLDPHTGKQSMQTWAERMFATLTNWLQYLDLSFLILAASLLGILIYNAFVVSVEDLVNNNFMSFTKDKDGFIHLQTYLGGFVLMPLLISALGGYGFNKGFKERRASFPKLLFAITVGVVVSLLVLYVIRGENPASANIELLAHANPTAMPIGSKPLASFNAIGMSILFDICLALLSWAFSLLGSGSRLALDRLNAFRNRQK